MTHIISSMNITINGCCDHRRVVADEEHHNYATKLVQSAGAPIKKDLRLIESRAFKSGVLLTRYGRIADRA